MFPRLTLLLALSVWSWSVEAKTDNVMNSAKSPLTSEDILSQIRNGYKEPSEEYLDRVQNLMLPKIDVKGSLLPEWKNPCWRRDGKFLCTPYFYIAGFRKCATSDLHNKVSLHPQVMRTWRKEDYWLSWHSTVHHMEEYAEIFGAKVAYEAERLPGKMVLGSGDPNVVWYFLSNQADEYHIPGPHLLRRIHPGAKIIIMLRNPTDRTFSDYIFEHVPEADPGSPDAFHEAMSTIVQRYNDCFRHRPLRECVFNVSRIHMDAKWGAPSHSMYVVFVSEWVKLFDKKNLLIIKTEDYRKEPTKTLRDVFRFLGVDELDTTTVHSIATMMVMNVGGQTTGHTVRRFMHQETRTMLDNFYRPFNRALAKFLDDERFLWNA